MMEAPMLSIYIPTYNHEKYIAQAIESVLMQKTQYTCEVLIGEDCSTDRTREILKAYEKNLPSNFQILYREHNMHREAVWNVLDLRMRCRGKYAIILEGDDFWTDPYKVEKQITFLEEHPDYIAVSHKCTIVDDDGNPTDNPIGAYMGLDNRDYTLNDYLNGILPGQQATVMYKTDFLRKYIHSDLCCPEMERGGAEDRYIYYLLPLSGKVYCSGENMSAYRYITDHGSSFSANYHYRFEDEECYYRRLMNYSYTTGSADAMTCGEILYIRVLKQGIQCGQCGYGQALRRIISNVRRKSTLLLMLRTRGEGYKQILNA